MAIKGELDNDVPDNNYASLTKFNTKIQDNYNNRENDNLRTPIKNKLALKALYEKKTIPTMNESTVNFNNSFDTNIERVALDNSYNKTIKEKKDIKIPALKANYYKIDTSTNYYNDAIPHLTNLTNTKSSYGYLQDNAGIDSLIVGLKDQTLTGLSALHTAMQHQNKNILNSNKQINGQYLEFDRKSNHFFDSTKFYFTNKTYLFYLYYIILIVFAIILFLSPRIKSIYYKIFVILLFAIYPLVITYIENWLIDFWIYLYAFISGTAYNNVSDDKLNVLEKTTDVLQFLVPKPPFKLAPGQTIQSRVPPDAPTDNTNKPPVITTVQDKTNNNQATTDPQYQADIAVRLQEQKFTNDQVSAVTGRSNFYKAQTYTLDT